MPAMPELRLQRLGLGDQSLSNRLALDDEPAGLPSRPTEMGEPQEVERLRLALAPPLPLLGCVTPEFDQACLVRVECQPERPQAVLPFSQEPLRIWPMLETEDDVIGIPDDHHVASRRATPPALDPEVEHVGQVHMREQW